MSEKWKNLNEKQENEFIDISIVLDRSGSMTSIKNDIVGGFNEFLKEQKAFDGKAVFTLAQFDNIYEIVHAGLDIQDVPDLNDITYVPRGGTALLDAMGRTINATEARVKENKAEKVIFVIITDGYENSSGEFSKSQVFDLINKHREDNNWEFVFIGADQDAIKEGGGYGFGAGSSMNYDKSSQGTSMLFAATSNSMMNYRSHGAKASGSFYENADQDNTKQEVKPKKAKKGK